MGRDAVDTSDAWAAGLSGSAASERQTSARAWRVAAIWLALLGVAVGAVAAAADDQPAMIKTPIGPGSPERLANLKSQLGPLEVTTTGQIALVSLFIDDGESTYLRSGDDTASPSLVNVTVGYPVENDLRFAFVYEVNYSYNASSLITQDDRWISPPGVDNRRIEFSVQHDTLGSLWLGKGHMAADTITQIDLSGTAMAAHNTISDHGGSLRFRDRESGDLTSTTIAAVFPDLDGDRLTRVRYDTMSVGGLTLSGSYADVDRWDVTLRFRREADGSASGRLPVGLHQVRGGIAYQDNRGTDVRSVVGSASAEWQSGLTLTFSGGQQFVDRGPDGYYTYAKLGWRGNPFAIGGTAVSIDGWLGFDFAPGVDQAQAIGLQVAQALDGKAVEVFAGIRHHWVDGDLNLEPIGILLTGFRVQF